MNTDFFKDRTVAVTGAAGFIGSHLTEALLAAGARVKALTRYNSKSDTGWLAATAPHPALTIIAGDIRDPFMVDRLVDGCDTIFHLAALIGIPFSYTAPQSYVETNINGTLNILEAARRHKTRLTLLTSTSEVYGTALRVPIDEEHPLQAQSPYSASKISADMLGNSYHCAFGLPVTIVRPFNTFGPRQSLRAVIPTIIAQALQSRCVKLGDTRPVRDFNFVTDTAAGFMAAARYAPGRAEVYNLATGSARTIGETADLIADLVGSRIEIVHDASRDRPADSEVMRLLGNAEKARRDLGWQPAVDFRTGLQKTVEWVRENLQTYADAASFKS
ncbi:MAG TPA: SDR family NAD(P)-dependent oxidoreductase [Candidatus Ozemobacteraceae bacterium]|nr:SDR family NAD(P)-dependent oxidoreductase [Candidatus Ozemobacteraceae bacterium]